MMAILFIWFHFDIIIPTVCCVLQVSLYWYIWHEKIYFKLKMSWKYYFTKKTSGPVCNLGFYNLFNKFVLFFNFMSGHFSWDKVFHMQCLLFINDSHVKCTHVYQKDIHWMNKHLKNASEDFFFILDEVVIFNLSQFKIKILKIPK